MQYFAYIHCKPDGTPFYVGKGNLRRSQYIPRKNIGHTRIVSKHGVGNIGVAKLECSSEATAFLLEEGLIRCLRRQGVNLVNATAGGEGTSGRKFTEEQKARCRERALGKTNPFFGRKHSDAVVKMLAEKATIEGSDPETRKRRSEKGKTWVGDKNPFFGKRHSDETKLKISKAKTGIPSKAVYSFEARKAISDRTSGEKHWNYGKTTPDRIKKLISESSKAKKGFKWVNNGLISKQARPEDIDTLLRAGYVFGVLKNKSNI